MSDNSFDIGFSEQILSLFEIDYLGKFVETLQGERLIARISLGLGQDEIISQRSVYTYFDLFGDVGGLAGTLFIIFQAVMEVYFYFTPDQILLGISEKVFHRKQPPQRRALVHGRQLEDNYLS